LDGRERRRRRSNATCGHEMDSDIFFSVISMSLSAFFDRSLPLHNYVHRLMRYGNARGEGGGQKIYSHVANLSDPVFSLARTLRRISTSMSKVTGIKEGSSSPGDIAGNNRRRRSLPPKKTLIFRVFRLLPLRHAASPGL